MSFIMSQSDSGSPIREERIPNNTHSIDLYFPPNRSQSRTNSSKNDNRIRNLSIDSIFPPTRSDSDSFTHYYATALSITSYFPPLKSSSESDQPHLNSKTRARESSSAHDEATSPWWITGEKENGRKREQSVSSSGPANSSGFTFTEANSVRASTSPVICCHFSPDGKVLASGGHDKKVVLWNTYSLKPNAILEEHLDLITDVCFSPSMSRVATSSFDKTVKVWDTDNPGYSYSLRTFTGHSSIVTSLDFHPNKDDLICSCDGDGEIRYWSFNNGSRVRVLKGVLKDQWSFQMGFQVRFQPRLGMYLATAAGNVVSILDVETGQPRLHSLQGHTSPVFSVCWDPNGDYLASVSEDSVRVWKVGSGEGDCIHELSCYGNKFRSCVFHPRYPSLLVIGCYQAHGGVISALAASTVTGLVASASYDKFVKLWK